MRVKPSPFMHNHSRWEPCSFRCPIWFFMDERFKAYYPDSDKRDIVINGVVFKG